jgi:hypothetical membrane protein
MIFEKSQAVRLIDIFILGPFLLFYALKTRPQVTIEEFVAIIIIAVATILYNGYNYLANIFPKALPPLLF